MQTPSDNPPFFSSKSPHYLSIAMRMSVEDKIQSCRLLLYTLNASIKFPLSMTWHLYYIPHISRITCTILSGIPHCCRTCHKYFLFMKSNAFSKSTIERYKIVFHSLACSKIIRTVLMRPIQQRFWRKSSCCFLKPIPITVFNLSRIILENFLLGSDRREISL